MNDQANQPTPSEWKIATLDAIQPFLGPATTRVERFEMRDENDEGTGEFVELFFFAPENIGQIVVTSGLVGREEQLRNEQGFYELAFCTREPNEWPVNILGQLAGYTLEESIEPGDTMDLSEVVPLGSSISALLFVDYHRFQVHQEDAGLLLCVGITPDELEACQAGELEDVFEKLKTTGILPHTDFQRESVLKS